jgi:ATP-dependent DNA helicase RecQ
VLGLSWSGKPSPFLRELGVRSGGGTTVDEPWPPEAQRLREWRAERAKTDQVPAYVVFKDSVLHAIAAARPTTLGELAQISGVGPAKLERYGDELLAVVAG